MERVRWRTWIVAVPLAAVGCAWGDNSDRDTSDESLNRSSAQAGIQFLCDADAEPLSQAATPPFGCDASGTAAVGDGSPLEPVNVTLKVAPAGTAECSPTDAAPCVTAPTGPAPVTQELPGLTYRYPPGGDWPQGPESAVTFVRVPAPVVAQILQLPGVNSLYINDNWCGLVNQNGSTMNRYAGVATILWTRGCDRSGCSGCSVGLGGGAVPESLLVA